MIFLIYIIIIIITGYFISGFLLYFLQTKIIYLPSNEIFKNPADEEMEYEDIDLLTPDGVKLNAWYIPNENSDKTVLFCHGNAGSLSHRIDTLKDIHEMGLSIFIFDYRSYGLSEGKISEKGTHIDAETALAFLVEEKQIPENSIISWGRSLGGPIAAKIARDHQVKACVLESTFTSIIDMAKERFKIYPSKLLARYSYPTIDYVKEIDVPLLIVHSHEDEIIPYWMGEKIFEKASEPKTFLKLRGDHNNAYFDSIDIYKKGLKGFFMS